MIFSRDKQHVLFPAVLLVTAIVLTYSRYTIPGIGADGQVYLQIARNIHYGMGLGWQALWVPPLQSSLIALAAWLPGVPNLQIASGIVSPLMGLLLPVAVYGLANRIFNNRIAFAAGLLTAFSPHLRTIQFSPEAEITYTVFLVLSLWLTLLAYQNNKIIWAGLSGISWALAYMGRSEGFLILFFTIAGCAVTKIKADYRAFVRTTAILLVGFLLISAPYLIFLKKHYGKITISPKATYVLIWMKSRIYHDNDKGETGNDELWGLTPEGKLKWQQASGVGNLVDYLMSHPKKSLKVYIENFSFQIPGRIPNNSGILHFPSVYQPFLVIIAVFAAFRRWGNDNGLKKAIIYTPFLILFILPVFTGGWWKYLLPYLPLLIIAASAGLFQLSEMIGNGKFSRLLPWSIVILLGGYYQYCITIKPSPPPNQDVRMRMAYSSDASKAAKWIRARLGPGKNYMIPWNKMIYDLDGIWTAEPVADYFSKLRYAQNNNVDYYLAEFSRKEVSSAEIKNPPPGMSLETVYESPETDYAVAVYRLNKSAPQ